MPDLRKARELAATDLPRCCAELLHWRKTGKLPPDAMMYQVGAAWSAGEDSHDDLQQAELVVTMLALQQVASAAATPVGEPAVPA